MPFRHADSLEAVLREGSYRGRAESATLCAAIDAGAAWTVKEGSLVRKVSLLAAALVVVVSGGIAAVAAAADSGGTTPRIQDVNEACEYRVSATGLNFRDAPGIHAPIEYRLGHGDTFMATDEIWDNAYDPYHWRLIGDGNWAANEYMVRTSTPCRPL
jgi:hypothetical protein